MKKISLITVVLLLSAAWVVAQTSPSSPSSQSPSTQSPSTTQSPSSTQPTAQQPETSTAGTEKSGGKAIEGCLNGSAGNYTLTDASGTTYQLSGDTSKLAEHVGHEIRVWGDTGSSTSAATSPSGASASSSQQTLNVTRVKMISSSCPTK